MREAFTKQGGIIFDSGGYYVQQGVVTYESLYQKLLEFYRINQWADWYVLPDYVPPLLSQLKRLKIVSGQPSR